MDKTTEKKLAELKSKIQSINKNTPILNNSKNNAIELDPKNLLHADWYNGK